MTEHLFKTITPEEAVKVIDEVRKNELVEWDFYRKPRKTEQTQKAAVIRALTAYALRNLAMDAGDRLFNVTTFDEAARKALDAVLDTEVVFKSLEPGLVLVERGLSRASAKIRMEELVGAPGPTLVSLEHFSGEHAGNPFYNLQVFSAYDLPEKSELTAEVLGNLNEHAKGMASSLKTLLGK